MSDHEAENIFVCPFCHGYSNFHAAWLRPTERVTGATNLYQGLQIVGCAKQQQEWATASEYARVRPSTHEYARVRTAPEFARVRPGGGGDKGKTCVKSAKLVREGLQGSC